jgi:hypothetical protein
MSLFQALLTTIQSGVSHDIKHSEKDDTNMITSEDSTEPTARRVLHLQPNTTDPIPYR